MAFIVGQVAMGDNFWNRKYELEDIWDAIESGSHLLLSAPRRVGKTSIMRNIEANPKGGFIVFYIDTESADSENEFWAKLYHGMIREDFVRTLKEKAKATWELVKKIRLKKVTLSGVEFEDGKITSFKESFKSLMESLDSNIKLIIMIDEFAQTVENIIEYEDKKHALALLKTHHELRQNKELSEKITFIYAGSIGLESVVRKIGGTKYINDLKSIKVLPFEHEEALKFIDKLLTDNHFEVQEEQILYILEKIEWLIPFYIQLILDELKKLSRRNSSISNETVDKAVNNAIEHRNYFDHWQIKLKEAFSKESYLFAKEILNHISENMIIDSKQISNTATKHKLDEDDAKDIVHSLVYDGYINNNDNVKEYRFNSAILRVWWNKYVAN